MELVNALELLKIKNVSVAWVDTVWDLEFTETDPLDVAIAEEITRNGSEAFKDVYRHLLPFATDGGGNHESVWTVFGENGVSASALVAVLSHFILGMKSKTASLPQRLDTLQAASLYMLILGIPGSIANKVFHPVLFEECLGLAKKCWPTESGKKRKKDLLKSSQADKGRKRSKPPRQKDEDMEIDESEEGDLEEEMLFSARELQSIREGIFCLVKTSVKLLSRFPLKDKPHCVQNCTQILTELTSFEPVDGGLKFAEGQDIDDMRTLPELAYHGLRMLCSAKHGEGSVAVRQVFHRLLYVILMMSEGDYSRPSLLVPTQAVLAARAQAIEFVSYIVDELKENALPTLRILLQNICAQMVDKVEYRTNGAKAVAQLLAKMPCSEYATFIQWLYSFSTHSKVVYRMFALDVVMALLEQPKWDVGTSLSPELAPFLQQRFLVQVMLFGRRSDRAPTVRSHALSCLAQCLELQSPNATESIHELFSSTTAQTILEADGSESLVTRNFQESNMHTRALNFKTIEMTKADVTTFDSKETIALLKRRSCDEKTNVRKSALQTLMSLLKHHVIPCSQENLSILSDRCRDSAVSVKKKALQCLMDLLTAQPCSSLVQNAWLRGVVPAVIDSESSVQEKALECLDQAILSQIKNQRTCNAGDVSQKLAWDLLGMLCVENLDLGRYFSKAFAIWSKQNKFSSAFVNNLISHIDTEHASAAWLLLSKVVGSAPRFNYSKILDVWDEMVRTTNLTVSTSCHVLRVIGEIVDNLNEETKSRIVDDIMRWLKSFELPLEVIGACVETLFLLGRAEALEDTQRLLNQHCGELVSLCESYLSGVILSEDGQQNFNEELVVKHLYTLGVAALQCPAKVGKRIILLVQSILFSNVELQSADWTDELPATLPQFKPSSMPTVVRAQAFITLGKLCLQHEDLAKRCIPALARELETSTEVPVRNNVVVVMCDLCVRYTTMVDHYVPNISACLKDSEPLIREQTLILLTNLLQEEFVKWKGSLFFHYAVALVDPEPRIASLCEFCLVHLLLKRNPIMFSQHFIECIFHFNSYEKHEKYNKFPQTASEKARFSLKGAKNKEKRMKIYRFLLEHFTDQQRFSITTKISQNILASFVDGVLPMDVEGAELLSDTFGVLSLKEIKLSALRNPVEQDEQQDDEMAMANAVMQVAQKRLISQVQKRNFIENVIPIIIALKAMLEEKRFPALRELMGYLQVTMQDYRNEVKEFFLADEQLAAELEYDMKQFKEQEMAQQLASTMETVPSSVGGPDITTGLASGFSHASPVAATGQSVLKTPLPLGSTHLHLPTPRPAGSSKRRSLSTTELLSKARKAAEWSGLRRGRISSAIDENVTPVNGSAISKQHLRLGSTTGRSAVGNRAISTPQRNMSELTFGEGFSAIFSAHGSGPKNPENEDHMLHFLSPDKPTPPPRQWNVDSPLCRKRRQRL